MAVSELHNIDAIYGSVSECQGLLTVVYFETQQEAEANKEWINRIGCGGGCTRHHKRVVGDGRGGSTVRLVNSVLCERYPNCQNSKEPATGRFLVSW